MIVNVKVAPNSKKSGVERIGENDFRVKVDAKAEGGRANRRLVEIVAEFFQVPKSSVRIVKGFKSRNKIVEIEKI